MVSETFPCRATFDQSWFDVTAQLFSPSRVDATTELEEDDDDDAPSEIFNHLRQFAKSSPATVMHTDFLVAGIGSEEHQLIFPLPGLIVAR
ncbi:hypothetical protein chiPu_0017101 [Chiloscyllium punctatum]|uniref:Uncharacterized protein n=1 Tax=Chiloscyllium punctatum TaxID=137246 RepID=A0A401T7D3_CHIPU|nr:hypothetical protein [Chiloscyllium punctatum]